MFLNEIKESLQLSFFMFYQVGWSLILGFLLSAIIQVAVPKQKVERSLGSENSKSIITATFFGAISSSCSYAAASMSNSLFKKGAGLIPSLAIRLDHTRWYYV